MGARPGEIDDESNFKLHNHIGLSPVESANKIVEHFAKISSEFAPLDVGKLPKRVTEQMQNADSTEIPSVYDIDIYEKILKANKPKSGVPGDLPRRIVSEFAPELSLPVKMIFKSILDSCKQGPVKWPDNWKKEVGVPLQKVEDPKNEDDLRVISLTSFFSKILESFVIDWLMFYIGDQIDPKQFGGLKGNSISHYLIELLNFILHNQDYNEPVAVLLCAIDFSKAFNRIDHNKLITKLSDMGTPGWLLNIVSGFLMERTMVVKVNGTTSRSKLMPGGGPQGTLLGLFLFLILINPCCDLEKNMSIGEQITESRRRFRPSTFYAKYVDDMSIGESFNIKEMTPSTVIKELANIKTYAEDNDMVINLTKTKFMLFNPTRLYDFTPDVTISQTKIETVEEMKILGVTLSNDLSWRANTKNIVSKGFKRLWSIKRLKANGASLPDLIDERPDENHYCGINW